MCSENLDETFFAHLGKFRLSLCFADSLVFKVKNKFDNETINVKATQLVANVENLHAKAACQDLLIESVVNKTYFFD